MEACSLGQSPGALVGDTSSTYGAVGLTSADRVVVVVWDRNVGGAGKSIENASGEGANQAVWWVGTTFTGDCNDMETTSLLGAGLAGILAANELIHVRGGGGCGGQASQEEEALIHV